MNNNKGFSIAEIVVVSGILSLLVVTLVGGLLFFSKSSAVAASRTQATLLAEEGIEAVRNMRDADIFSLVDGTYGIDVVNNIYVLSGSNDTTDVYTRTVSIAAGDTDIWYVTSTVSWAVRGIPQAVSLATVLTNWSAETSSDATCLTFDTTQTCFDDTTSYKDLLNITVTNTCAYDVSVIGAEVAWDTSAKLTDIIINSTSTWSSSCDWGCTPTGIQNSGVITDFGTQSVTITSSSSIPINTLTWNGNMSGATISTFGLLLSDGSTSTISNIVPGNCDTFTPDTTPPNAISDLSVTSATNDSLAIAWTATGDDGVIGTATAYDIRYSRSPITESNWSLATEVVGEPIPAISGSSESMTLSGLSSGIMYYVAIKVQDDAGNESALSNVATGQTLSSTQASQLVIHTSAVSASGNGKSLNGITFENTGASTITIDSLTLSWVGGANGNNVQGISIDGTTVWTGNSSSGILIDILNTDILLASEIPSVFSFKKSISGATVTITATMIDGSSVTSVPFLVL